MASNTTPAPGALVFLAANDPHNAKNVGTTPATYYVINFVTDLSHAANAKSAAEQAIPGKLASSVIDCSSQPSTPTPTGSRVTCVSSPTLTFLALESHITTLNPGQQTANMIDSNDEIVVIKSGQLEITVNGVACRMNAGSLLYWPPTTSAPCATSAPRLPPTRSSASPPPDPRSCPQTEDSQSARNPGQAKRLRAPW